jgi:hypothetical protein
MTRNLPRVAYRAREVAELTGLSLFLYYAIQHKDLPTVRVCCCRLIIEKALCDQGRGSGSNLLFCPAMITLCNLNSLCYMYIAFRRSISMLGDCRFSLEQRMCSRTA